MSLFTVEEIENLPNHPEKLLIDVRDPPEIKSTGSIPTSINIPRKYYMSLLFDVSFYNFFFVRIFCRKYQLE